ncbi:MAG: SH3 domain-containing protein, partial [Microcystis aeruginosa]
IAVLVGALKERVPADLLASQNSTPAVVFLARLTKKLQDNLGLAEEAARWAVESWALALEVISSNDLKTNPSLAPPIPTPVPTPIPTPVTDSAGQPTSSFSVSSTIPVQLPVNPVTIPSQPVPPPTPPSPSNNWTKIAIALGSVGVLALVGSVVHFQEQQKQASDREIAELKAREEQRLEAEQRQREEAERQRKEAEQQLAEEQSRRQEAEVRLEAERQYPSQPQIPPPSQPPPKVSSSGTNATVSGTPGTKNIRSGAGTVYGVVRTVRTGDRLQILGSSYDRGGYQWYKVYHPQSGTTGWIAAQLISSD